MRLPICYAVGGYAARRRGAQVGFVSFDTVARRQAARSRAYNVLGAMQLLRHSAKLLSFYPARLSAFSTGFLTYSLDVVALLRISLPPGFNRSPHLLNRILADASSLSASLMVLRLHRLVASWAGWSSTRRAQHSKVRRTEAVVFP